MQNLMNQNQNNSIDLTKDSGKARRQEIFYFIHTNNLEEINSSIKKLNLTGDLEGEENKAFIEKLYAYMLDKHYGYVMDVKNDKADAEDNLIESTKNLQEFRKKFGTVVDKMDDSRGFEGDEANGKLYKTFSDEVKRVCDTGDIDNQKHDIIQQAKVQPAITGVKNDIEERDYGYFKYIRDCLKAGPYFKGVSDQNKLDKMLNYYSRMIVRDAYESKAKKDEIDVALGGEGNNPLSVEVMRILDQFKDCFEIKQVNSKTFSKDVGIEGLMKYYRGLFSNYDHEIEAIKTDGSLTKKQIEKRIQDLHESKKAERQNFHKALKEAKKDMQKDDSKKDVINVLEDEFDKHQKGEDMSKVKPAQKAVNWYADMKKEAEQKADDSVQEVFDTLKQGDPITGFLGGVLKQFPEGVQYPIQQFLKILEGIKGFFMGILGLFFSGGEKLGDAISGPLYEKSLRDRTPQKLKNLDNKVDADKKKKPDQDEKKDLNVRVEVAPSQPANNQNHQNHQIELDIREPGSNIRQARDQVRREIDGDSFKDLRFGNNSQIQRREEQQQQIK